MSKAEAVDFWTLSDLCTPRCIHVAATLRIALNEAASGLLDLGALLGLDLNGLGGRMAYS